MLAAFLLPIILILAIGIIMVIAQWKIYTKANKPGWAVLIPIYREIVMLEIIGRPWWTLFMFIIPIYGFILAIQCVHGLSKSFGKDAGFTCGIIFLPLIFLPILGFGSAKYVGPGGQAGATATA